MRPRPAGLAPRPTRPLDTPELELASYLLARRVTGQPVVSDAQSLLRRAHQSRQDVLALMPHGRGNVQTDLDATANTGLHRVRALRDVVGSLSTLGAAQHQREMQAAALAARAGAGNCGEFANLALHVHAGRLQPGERLQMQRADADHAWAVVQGAAMPAGSRPAAVIDAWCDGPVIEPGDGAFSSGTASDVQNLHSIESTDAAQVHNNFNAARLQRDSTRARRLEAMIARHARDDLPPTGTVYAPTSVVAPKLADAAQQAIAAHPSPRGLRCEAVEAVLAARPSLPRAWAEAAAPTVIQMAGTLREPRGRALQLPPDLSADASVGADSSLGADSDADVEQPPRQRRRIGDGADGADGPRSV